MGKGFTVDPDLRKERAAVCTTYEDTIAWAVANRPGAVPINGGRSRFYRTRLRNSYAIFLQQQRKTDKRARLGRFTARRPKITRSEESVEETQTEEEAESQQDESPKKFGGKFLRRNEEF